MSGQKILKVLFLFCLLISFVSFPTKATNGTVTTALAASNNRPIGYVDVITTSASNIGGWAFDPDTSSTSITVRFEIDGQSAGSMTTNVYRPDVNSAFGITGNHGFNWTIPSQYRGVIWHTVRVLAVDSNTNISYRNEEIDRSPARYKYTTGSVSYAEKVFDWSNNKCEDLDLPDTPARAFKDDSNKIQLLAVHYKAYRNIGNTFSSLSHDCDNGLVFTSDNESIPDNYNNMEWLSAPFTLEGHYIYNIIHNEYHYNSDWVSNMYTTLTLASSSNRGRTYSHAAPRGHLVFSLPFKWDMSPTGPRGNPPAWYGVGFTSNIIGREGYYYMFATTHYWDNTQQQWIGGTCVFRTPDFRIANSWRGWNGTSFAAQSVDPYSYTGNPPPPSPQNTCTPFSSAANGWTNGMSISSITFNSALNQWLAVGFYDHPSDKSLNGFYYITTTDSNFLNWSAPQRLMYSSWGNTNRNNIEPQIFYPSLIDHNAVTRNFEDSGASPYLYFTRENNMPSNDRDLLRIQIQLP
jgi:hypothetical protein